MLGNYEALGYICMGILAFALGVCVTILCIVCVKRKNIEKAEEYKQSQQVRENRLKKNNNNKAGKNRMNFEIIDNIFQVIVFSLIVVADIVCWFLHKNRLYIILALAHSCFYDGNTLLCTISCYPGKRYSFFMYQKFPGLPVICFCIRIRLWISSQRRRYPTI